MSEEEKSRCQNCTKTWAKSQLNPIKDIFQRVDPGEPMPSGVKEVRRGNEYDCTCHRMEEDDTERNRWQY